MENTIPVPKLLQNRIARDLNTKMLTNNQSFVFLGEPEVMINRTPSTFLEAFDMYVVRLYVVYHDYGMKFLECYGSELFRINNTCAHISHIHFINNCRAALAHSSDPTNVEQIYNNLKKHFFKNDTSFQYNDWQDFWQNATESHWEELVKVIVKDSDSFMKFLENVASHTPNYKAVYNSVSEIFTKKRVYSDTYQHEKNIDIYINSINSRFLKPICIQLINTSEWRDIEKAKQELRTFYNLDPNPVLSSPEKLKPQQMRDELIKIMMSSLENNDYTDSELFYRSIIQNIKLLIDDQINKDFVIEEDDILDP